MRICLLGDFSGTPDEGMKNISLTTYQRLEPQHEVMQINTREVLQIGVLKTLKAFKPQIIHSLHGPTIRSLIILKLLRLFLGRDVKFIVSATRPYFSQLSRWAIPFLRPDLTLTQSEKSETFFKDRGCAVQFFPNGVNCQKFSPVSYIEKQNLRRKYDLPLNKKIILHVGHIKQNRKLDLFFELQEKPAIQVVIVGGTVEQTDESLKDRLQKAGIRVIHKYLADISEIYKAADIYLFPIRNPSKGLPSRYNQIGSIDLPLSVLEAMSCNLPVITTPFGALPRLFQNGQGLEYAKPEELVQRAQAPIDHNLLATRDKVLSLDWEIVIDNLVTIYRKIQKKDRGIKPAVGREKLAAFKLLNIIGIDGSGKTTLATSLASELQQVDTEIRYRYCQYFAKLLYPIKLLAKLSVMRKTDAFKNYPTYNKTKTEISRRYPLLAKLYATLWFIDYLLQVCIKIHVAILVGRRLIIDRYIFDIAVNLSLSVGEDIDYAKKLIRLFFKFSRKPDVIILIDLPEEMALARKDDIQDVEYLQERRRRYLELSKEFGFTILDGTKKPEELLEAVKQLLSTPIYQQNDSK
ncbi:MAG: hypothetical protein COA36_16305 [Desulfotalea sp.]|nr:MAG: hypothetical protein COA36_16305 [Desulfotalea sp.]